MPALGFSVTPRFAEPKQLNSGREFAAAPVSSLFGALPCGGGGVGAVDLPSRWQELQFALPRNRLKPAISSADNGLLVGSCRKASNFDEKALTSGEASY